jgi:lactate 2-monooxygenase
MARFGLQSDHSHPEFPYDPSKSDKKLKEGDEVATKTAKIALEWMKEISSGVFHTWEDVAFLRENWDGPIVLKGVQCPEVSPFLRFIL